ncbi:hypothetical protein WQ54_29750 [Bacillus sp. SA1-12]|uniref:HD domain-containing protein n=1 Tax=Bacillus sp. SA1-12 TaxID=1455638 RepID=UPI0006271CEB|nr:HD domain-containing protein [Bacillus sp. SA1-12]KKI88700.1 hypothetical protein WQ54_29750 [Bacillus sp. SA1-12]
MDNKLIVQNVEDFVYKRLYNEGSGHDWWHIDRVRRNALYIGKEENANLFIVELAALLHDLIDDKLSENIKLDVSQVEQFLLDLGIDQKVTHDVISIIKVISFRKKIPQDQLTLAAKVVQDADRLDAIGAIGIARTFAYAGSKGNLIYHPDVEGNTDAISHFYDKLLKLKDLMNTNAGRVLAKERHQFLELYLSQFYHEWNGRK